MKRPPFDPNRARGNLFEGGLFDPTPSPTRPTEPAAPSELPPQRIDHDSQPTRVATSEISVTAFNELVARTLEDGMRGSFRVQGEIANLSKRNHWYFSVKDAKSVLSCVMWASDAARVAFDPREGDAVVVTGKIGHFAAQGRTQLYATRLEPQGVGALELKFQQLVKELRERGYFLDERKKALPANPRRVAVVTSANGAALQDVLKTAMERRAGVEFIVVDVRVQGEGAAIEVARALRALDARRAELALDAVIVTRGGGSREDLWAFNERIVAEAAFAMHLPLVAAIGHEVDTSVIELVADRRASTPTQAVMLLLPDTSALIEHCERMRRDLVNAMRWSIQSKREGVARLERAPALTSPALRIARARQAVHGLANRLRRATADALASERYALERIAARLASNAPAARAAAARASLAALRPRLLRASAQRIVRERGAIANLERRLRSAGPEETLQRGYAIVTSADGTLVRSMAAARDGERLDLQVVDGMVPVRVELGIRRADAPGPADSLFGT